MRATNYKSVDVDGLSIFYRETSNPDAPKHLATAKRWTRKFLLSASG
jgi:hypothetical protein